MRRPFIIVSVAVAVIALAAGAGASASTRLDPYKHGHVRAEVIKHRDGGDPSTSYRSPGRHKYKAVTLERGLTQDGDLKSFALRSVGGGSFEDSDAQRHREPKPSRAGRA